MPFTWTTANAFSQTFPQIMALDNAVVKGTEIKTYPGH